MLDNLISTLEPFDPFSSTFHKKKYIILLDELNLLNNKIEKYSKIGKYMYISINH